MPIPTEKRCGKCRETKPAGEYHRHAASRDGLQNCCKACSLAIRRAWVRANPDKVREYNRLANAKPDALEKQRASRKRLIERDPQGWSDRAAAREAKKPHRHKERYWADQEGQRERVRTYRRTRADSAKKREAEAHRRRQYGLSPQDYAAMLVRQENKCRICATAFEETKPCVDHDHETGAVRGLLCRDCNLGLGYLERPGFMAAAQQYLSDHASMPPNADAA